MVGIQSLLVDDLFREIDARRAEQPISVCILIRVSTCCTLLYVLCLQVLVSFFEIYGGRCQDLLNNRQRLNIREDGAGEVRNTRL
jgi:hypothetical protein